MSDSAALIESISAIYDAGTDSDRWPNALDKLRQLTGSKAALLQISKPQEYLLEITSGIDAAPLPSRAVRNELLVHNPWRQRAPRISVSGQAMLGEQVSSATEVRRTRLYEELIRHTDTFWLCGVVFHNTSDAFGSLELYRGERESPFSFADRDLADAVAPHLGRAVRIASLLSGQKLYGAGLEAAAAQFAFGLIFLDNAGRILFANPEAERLLACSAVRGLDGRIVAGSGSAGEQLRTFVRRLTLLAQGGAMRLSHEDKSLKIIGMPLPARRQDFSCLTRSASSVLFLLDESRTQMAPIRAIAELYRLTPAETRLVEALLTGQSLGEYGERARLSRNTLKTQIRSIFAKTGTSRQAQLIRHLSQLSAVAKLS